MIKVAIVGATGETGRSIIDGLLHLGSQFEITALTRPSSVQQKPMIKELEARGVKIVPADLQGPQDELVKVLTGFDVLISAIYFQALLDEIPLANAAKAAGIKRFVPCSFATPAPRGVMFLRDTKEKILDHVQQLRIPYTIIDVGWWYQITLPRVPSGKLDYALLGPVKNVTAGGDIPSALTDVRDIGTYVAKIITDPRTLNKRVFAYTEIRTQNEVFDLVEKLSGEKPERTDLSAADLEVQIKQTVEREDLPAINMFRSQLEYMRSWGVRGDNTPENAQYLGYLLADDLYPGLKGRSFESYVQEVVDGKAEMVHKEMLQQRK